MAFTQTESKKIQETNAKVLDPEFIKKEHREKERVLTGLQILRQKLDASASQTSDDRRILARLIREGSGR